MNFGFLAQSPTPALEIRDIAPPVEVFPYPLWLVATVVLAAVALIALIVWLVTRWYRNRPAVPPPTPREIALGKLEKARQQLDTLEPYAFSIVVSDILRGYLTDQYRLRATQQTSPEFIASVQNSARFTHDEKAVLADFLEKCDLIKFARIEAGRDDSAALFEQAMRVVKGGAS